MLEDPQNILSETYINAITSLVHCECKYVSDAFWAVLLLKKKTVIVLYNHMTK